MAELRVSLCFSTAPRTVHVFELLLPPGTTLAQSVQMASQTPSWPADLTLRAAHEWGPGVWGRKAGWDTVLRDGDRVELSRALRVDPKVARRERFEKQGARRTGLFANRRPNAGAGYGA